jgi:hypothetical protein
MNWLVKILNSPTFEKYKPNSNSFSLQAMCVCVCVCVCVCACVRMLVRFLGSRKLSVWSRAGIFRMPCLWTESSGLPPDDRLTVWKGEANHSHRSLNDSINSLTRAV